jgi:hypothetical protein
MLLALALALADPTLPAASPEQLCRRLADEPAQRCTVLRRAAHGQVEAAVLRLTGERSTELWLAAASSSNSQSPWQLVRSAGTAYNFQDLRGQLTIRTFAIHQLVPGGTPEIDLVVSRWQSTLASPDACSLQKLPETHRYIVARHDAGWRTFALATAREPGATRLLTPDCTAPSWTPPPTWSLTLDFTADTLTIRHHHGPVPKDIHPILATHRLTDIFLPSDAPPALASLPDTI